MISLERKGMAAKEQTKNQCFPVWAGKTSWLSLFSGTQRRPTHLAGGDHRVLRKTPSSARPSTGRSYRGMPERSDSSAYTQKEAVGQPITLIIPQELWEEERLILSRLRRGERIEQLRPSASPRPGAGWTSPDGLTGTQ